jgi:hypothetical protein
VSSGKTKFNRDRLKRELMLKFEFPYRLTDSFYNAERENIRYYHYAIGLLKLEAQLDKTLHDQLLDDKVPRNLESAEPSTLSSKEGEGPQDLNSRLEKRRIEMSQKQMLLSCWHMWVNGFIFTIRKQISLTKKGLLELMYCDKQSTYLVENALKFWRDVDSERLNLRENPFVPIPYWLTDHIDLIDMIYTHMDRCVGFLECLKKTHSGSIGTEHVNLQTSADEVGDNEAIESVDILLKIMSETLETFYFLIPERLKFDLASNFAQEITPIICDHVSLSDYEKAMLKVLLNERSPISKDEIISKVNSLKKEGYKLSRFCPNTVNGYLRYLQDKRFISRCSPDGTTNENARRYILSPHQSHYVRNLKLPVKNDPKAGLDTFCWSYLASPLEVFDL